MTYADLFNRIYGGDASHIALDPDANRIDMAVALEVGLRPLGGEWSLTSTRTHKQTVIYFIYDILPGMPDEVYMSLFNLILVSGAGPGAVTVEPMRSGLLRVAFRWQS